MVHYIRYLRVPQVSKVDKRALEVSGVVAVTTDLGDAFYSQELALLVRVVDATRSGEVLHQETWTWRIGDRALKFTMKCPVKVLGRLISFNTTTQDTMRTVETGNVPLVLDVWSLAMTMKLDQKTEPLVERRLCLPNKSTLRIQEETGDSIARHIWDASLGFMMYFDSFFCSKQSEHVSTLNTLLKGTRTKKLKVLELGAGCGIVGIALAQLVKCDLVVSDLEEAQDLLQSNIRCAKLPHGATVRSQVLDWADAFERTPTKYDLILVSDCIYNPDTSIHLVETLRQAALWSPELLILIGYKRRHEADTIFFEHMQKAAFEVIESSRAPLPHSTSEYDNTVPEFELFSYRLPRSAT